MKKQRSIIAYLLVAAMAISLMTTGFAMSSFDGRSDSESVAMAATSTDATPGDAEDEELLSKDGIPCVEQELTLETGRSGETIILSGILPEDVTGNATSVDVSDYDEFDGKEVVCAYDITLYSNGQEYEPEFGPLTVKIINQEIEDAQEDGSDLSLYHIEDSGNVKKTGISDVEGDTLTFDAESFSVYAITKATDSTGGSVGWNRITTVDELITKGSQGVYIGQQSGFFFTDSVETIEEGRTGIARTSQNNANNIQKTPHVDAAVYYFEQVEGKFYVYCLKGGEKYYIVNDPDNSLNLSTSIDSNAAFTISGDTSINYVFTVKGETNYWNMTNNLSGKAFGASDDASVSGSRIQFWYYTPASSDPYGLDGKSYVLLNYASGTYFGVAVSASSNGNTVAGETMGVAVKKSNKNDKLYVPKGTDTLNWTFEWKEDNIYYISADVSGTTKYINVTTASNVALTTEKVPVRVTVGSNGKILIESLNGNRVITYNKNNGNKFITEKTVTDVSGDYKSPKYDDSVANNWINLAEATELTDQYENVRAARKISVSDKNITTGSKVILYTRKWNETGKKYEFYAVDHDGSLVRCYESGDNLLWIGSGDNTLLWEFTEYFYSGTNDPNYYYELYNPYSQKYIAPQKKDNQLLSDNKIGISLPGRKAGDYYSEIMAWDDEYYTYAIVSTTTGDEVVSVPRSDFNTEFTKDFYFATMDDFATATLETVDTLDNHLHGITMKMADFKNTNQWKDGVQCEFLKNYSNPNGENNPVQNLLSKDLKGDGYPTATSSGESLKKLFEEKSEAGTYQEVNHLFMESIYNGSGYYEYDSTQNFAHLKENGDFIVYKSLGTHDAADRPTRKHGQFFPYNDLTPGVYSVRNPENLYDALAKPLPDSDPRKHELLYRFDDPDYQFGMEVSARFVQTPDGKDAWGHDIIYEFTGDDDFWLYVDGELVIDLGGVHSALAGSVNFSTGEVWVNSKDGKPTTTLYEIFEKNYKEKNPSALDEDVAAYLDGIFKLKDGNYTFKDYTPHTMRIFFMERGQGASNLHMRFNLTSVKEGEVTLNKTLSGVNQQDYRYTSYPYQIFYQKKGETGYTAMDQSDDNYNVILQNSDGVRAEFLDTYIPPNGTKVYNNVYLINPGKPVTIRFPNNTEKYYIVECGISSEVYDVVKINGEPVSGTATEDSNRKDYTTIKSRIVDRPTVVYDNHVKEPGKRPLVFTKKLYDYKGKLLSVDDDKTTFTFRLYLGDEKDANPTLANMQEYFVKDPAGNYCKWDNTTDGFTSIGKSVFADLTAAEINDITFETSPNGSISKIPANYQVEVRDLLIGSIFEVEERASDMPQGYKIDANTPYKRMHDSYQQLGDVNIGRIIGRKPNTNTEIDVARMEIHNRQGWGFTVEKVWSDADLVDSHGDIYIGVFPGDSTEPVPGSLRRISHPTTSVYYHFDSLLNGYTFADYNVREVKIENPECDTDGYVTSYKSVMPVNEIMVSAKLKDSLVESDYDYSVTVVKGAASGGTSPGNVRTDTITNKRIERIATTGYVSDKKPYTIMFLISIIVLIFSIIGYRTKKTKSMR